MSAQFLTQLVNLREYLTGHHLKVYSVKFYTLRKCHFVEILNFNIILFRMYVLRKLKIIKLG